MEIIRQKMQYPTDEDKKSWKRGIILYYFKKNKNKNYNLLLKFNHIL